ncbi:MAG: PIG-L family deacetylase [Luteolibacter sp.]
MIANITDLPDLGIDGIHRVAVVVAHPDDEILWAGGLLLSHPEWSPFIVSLCRGSDPDRAPKFSKVLTILNAQGIMGDTDDGPDQFPLPDILIQDAILSLLPRRDYDLLLTHAPDGEYTRHRRHEEVSRAVMALWREGKIRAERLWQFAYEDGGRTYAPRPRQDASIQLRLSDELLTHKSAVITEVYGFGTASWEARAVTGVEAFHCFHQEDSTSPIRTVNLPPKP